MPPVGPQVRAADTGGGQANDRVSCLEDPWVAALFDPHVTRGIHDGTTHNDLLYLGEVAPFDDSWWLGGDHRRLGVIPFSIAADRLKD
jgi:hypothetical protein